MGKKTAHEGHTLWIKCMNGNAKAWATMEQYNKNDVVIMEKVYHKLLPWIKTTASFSARNDDHLCCPNCGSKKYQQRGYAYSLVSKYARLQCLECYSWFRTTVNEHEKRRLKYVPI